jgi:hypothetical protein
MKQVWSIADRDRRSRDRVNGPRTPGFREPAGSGEVREPCPTDGRSSGPAGSAPPSEPQPGRRGKRPRSQAAGKMHTRIGLARWRMES